MKDETIGDAIRQRGGGQGQISELQTDYQNLTVGALANLASEENECTLTCYNKINRFEEH